MRQREPLSREEMEPLWRWERQMTWFHTAAMGGLLLVSVVAYRFNYLDWLGRPVLGLVLLLLAAAAVLQFRVRCPRCGARLHGKIIKLLPDKCAVCGVELPRPPSASG